MSQPKRVQRTRTKGGGIPEGATYVGRPTRWGNPFSVVDADYGHAMAVTAFRVQIEQRGHYWPSRPGIEYTKPTTIDDIKRELRGKDLACWCPLVDKDGRPVPCHADILLAIANA